MARPNRPWFRKDIGWWMVTLDGRKVRLAQGKKNKKQAERAFHEVMALRAQQPESPSARVADVVEAFLAWARPRLADDTYIGYRHFGQKFAEQFGYLSVSELQPFHVTRWVSGFSWGETTEFNARRSVFRAFSWAVKEGLLPRNPLQGMPRPRPRFRQRSLTIDEYRALIAGAHGELRILLWALRQTGARPCELRKLTWDQVRSDRWVIPEHKTDRNRREPRVVYLTPPMQRLMQYLRARSQSKHVFVNSRGAAWTRNAIRLRVHRLRKKLGLADDVCAYLFRHTFGTHAIINNCNPSVVAELMGHSSLEMVSKVYVHLAEQENHLQQAIQQATRPVERRPSSP